MTKTAGIIALISLIIAVFLDFAFKPPTEDRPDE